MDIIYSAYTYKGNREENQDRIMVVETPILKAFAVADGIGSLDYGGEAAAVVLKAFEDELNDCGFCNLIYIKELIRLKIKQINGHIHNYCKTKGMLTGTTLSVLVLCDSGFVLGNVGDTKVYLIRDEYVKLISCTHSLASNKNVLTMAIGPSEKLEPYILEGRVYEGDFYIICSDGVHNFIEEEEFKDIFEVKTINSSLQLGEKVKQAVQKALLNGSNDNLSIIAIKVKNVCC